METVEKINERKAVLCVIGLGYVGLPLAVYFANKYRVIGFDINKTRVDELKSGFDRTLEVEPEEFEAAKYIEYTSNIEEIRAADIYIVTVPTPIDKYKNPDLKPLKSASATVGKVLSKGNIVVYESTVFPGCTEDECVPILEKESGLKFNEDFFCGYSPERINPGDKEHRVSSIRKIVSGSTEEIAAGLNELYSSIIEAGTFLAPSIKVAEAAKVIENSQRDINIAFVNELAKIFNLMGIDTLDVLEAAGTKWNFLPFKPGLVGGHCISVDPYYLTQKAVSLGYQPEVILSGRRINDHMGYFIAGNVIKLMIKKGYKIDGAKVLVLGITFKENCPDIRNTRVVDIIAELKEYGCNVDIYDPWADKHDVKEEYGLDLVEDISKINISDYKAVVMAVAHKKFIESNILDTLHNGTVIYDVKGILPRDKVDMRL